MNPLNVIISIFLFLPLFVNASANSELSEQQQYEIYAENVWNSLHKKTGEIKLPDAVATLNVPQGFVYLDSKDAEKVLVDIWGNPPGQDTLGMLFPYAMTPLDYDAWAVTIEYEEDGYVSDENADEIDYYDMLVQMQSDTKSISAERVNQGYQPIELVGWASPPYYDAESHKLYWAKEIKFGNNSVNTLNYNIRILGRKGVLVLNFIAQIDQKSAIESQFDSVLAIANFDQGSTYNDFNPEIDDVAAYGLGALVAGKVIAKTGLLAGVLIFLKKFIIVFIVAIGAFFKRLFKQKKSY